MRLRSSRPFGPGRNARWLGAVIVVLSLALGLAACGGGGSSSSSSSSTGSSGSSGEKEEVTLQWWDSYGNIPERNEALQAVFDEIKEKTGITVERTTFEYGEFQNKLVQAAATGEFPDIALVDQGEIPAFSEQGIVADLTEKVDGWSEKGQILPNILEADYYEEKYWGAPFLTNATALFYNADELKAAGIQKPPATWEELKEDAKTLTSGNTSGFCFSANATEEGSSVFEPFLWQAGGDIPTIGDEASVEALEFVNGFVEEGSSPKSVLSWGQNDVANQFIAGSCAMMINGPWELEEVGDSAKFNWETAPLPEGKEAASSLGGEQLVISKDADVDAAWEVAEQVLNPKVIGPTAIMLGGLPNRKDTENDPEWLKGHGRKAFAEAVPVARPRSIYGPQYNQISEQIWTMVQNVLSGSKSASDAAKEAGATIEPLLPTS
jgi:multiple sugar transport system substrate-binding protein